MVNSCHGVFSYWTVLHSLFPRNRIMEKLSIANDGLPFTVRRDLCVGFWQLSKNKNARKMFSRAFKPVKCSLARF